MALKNCPECDHEVSKKAMQCPNCGHVLQKTKRGFFGKIFKWLLILFNLFMLVWIFSFGDAVVKTDTTYMNDAETAGTAIGAGLGFTFQLIVMSVGNFILGMLTFFTRAK